MDEIKIYASVIIDRGRHGFTENYDENVTEDEYIRRFEQQAINSNQTRTAKVHFMERSLHNEDGSYQLDDNERIDYEIIYVNKDIQNSLRGI